MRLWKAGCVWCLRIWQRAAKRSLLPEAWLGWEIGAHSCPGCPAQGVWVGVWVAER